MADVVGIRFKSCGKIYDFEVNGLEVKKGETVVVESDLGLSIGNVVVERHPLSNGTKELKKVMRIATEEDLRQRSENETFEAEARAYCVERIMARGLPMKLICTEATLDRKRIIFYFAADGRIDFRELVKDLAAKFKTRIEMRQIGVRDEAKIIGGLGICGRELCCKRFLISFEPISIKMAKSQELVLNANKLSGVCGRLMCCLSYEYSENEEEAPAEAADSVIGEPADEVVCDIVETPAPATPESGHVKAERSSGGGKIDEVPPRISVKQGAQEQRTDAEKKVAESAGSPSGDHPPSADEGEKKFHRRRRRRRRKFHK